MNYGILIYNEKFWLGSSIYNLLQPDISFIEKNSLNRNYSLHGGINIDERISPSIHYIKYPSFILFNLGSYFIFNPMSIGFGIEVFLCQIQVITWMQ